MLAWPTHKPAYTTDSTRSHHPIHITFLNFLNQKSRAKVGYQQITSVNFEKLQSINTSCSKSPWLSISLQMQSVFITTGGSGLDGFIRNHTKNWSFVCTTIFNQGLIYCKHQMKTAPDNPWSYLRFEFFEFLLFFANLYNKIQKVTLSETYIYCPTYSRVPNNRPPDY